MARGWLMAGVVGLSGCEALRNLGQACEPDGTRILEKVSGDGQRGAPGVPLALPLAVRVTDSCGVAVPDRKISWLAYDGSVSPRENTSGSNGQASAIWTPSDDPDGLNRLDAELDSPGPANNVHFTAYLTSTPPTSPGACVDFVLTDPFNNDAGWTKTTEATPGFEDSVRFEPTGGVAGGGYRRMTHELPTRGDIIVSHWYASFYNPRQEGSIRRIHYVEDRIQFSPPFPGAAVGSGLLVQQGGRRVALPLPVFRDTSWQRAELDVNPGDLPGIDLTTAGAPLQFGYYRSNTSNGGITVQHGIDNWTVEICR